jgi:hypothetical protein
MLVDAALILLRMKDESEEEVEKQQRQTIPNIFSCPRIKKTVISYCKNKIGK